MAETYKYKQHGVFSGYHIPVLHTIFLKTAKVGIKHQSINQFQDMKLYVE
jgi:hypothetical protein